MPKRVMDALAPLMMNLIAAGGKEGGEEGGHHALGLGVFGYIGIVVAVIFIFLFIAQKGYSERVCTTWPAKLAEHVYLFLERVAVGIIGPQGRYYIGFLATLWLFIFVSNILGLFLPYTPTGNIGVNLAMSICTVAYVQYEGIRANGFFGHLKHFAGPKLPLSMLYISVLMFVVEIVSESAKVLSLALRLFGNIEGGHLVVKNLNGIWSKVGLDALDGYIPLGYFLIPIKLLTAIIQAFVWVMLTAVYISLVTHHEGEEHGHDDHGHAAHPTPQHA